jgi:hypothetical protein
MVKDDKIGIYYLAHRRGLALPLVLHFFNKIKEENKKNIVFYILSDTDEECYRNAKNELEENGIKTIQNVMNGSYINKIKWALDRNHEYSWKMDDDVFLNQYVIDFIIENRSILDEDSNLIVAPILSAGIPTHDHFVNDFLTLEQTNILHKEILRTRFFKFLGCDYTFLNKHTLESKEWDRDSFYNSVKSMNHFYKGIHPIRLNKNAALMLNNFIIDNFEKFLTPDKYDFLYLDYPYLCNSCFLIKNEIWRKIIEDKSLYVDKYGEVPLNRYRERSGKKIAYIDKSKGIHMIFNTCIIQSDMSRHEMEFVDSIKRILNI